MDDVEIENQEGAPVNAACDTKNETLRLVDNHTDNVVDSRVVTDNTVDDDDDGISRDGTLVSVENMFATKRSVLPSVRGSEYTKHGNVAEDSQEDEEHDTFDHGAGDDYSYAGTVDTLATILASKAMGTSGSTDRAMISHRRNKEPNNDTEPAVQDIEEACETKDTTSANAGRKMIDRRKVYVILICLTLIFLAVVAIGTVMGVKSLNASQDGSKPVASSPTDGPSDVGSSPTNASPGFSTSSPSTATITSSTDTPTLSPSAAPTLTLRPSSATTDAPTAAPSLAPTINVIDPLIEFLQDYEVLLTKDPLSPPFMAAQWLSEEANESLGSDDGGGIVLDDKLVQRFALLTLSYSLRQTFGNESQGELDVDDGGRRRINSDPDFSYYTKVNNTAVKGEDECNWPGIICLNSTVTEIHFSYSELAGVIPPEIRLLSDLVVLDLAGNSLRGSIPEELYELTQLEEIFLYHNQLTGTISAQVGDLENVTRLHFSHNFLSGSIPDSLKSGSLIRPLRYVNLYSNQFTGTIPADLRWRQAVHVDLGRNLFHGTVNVLDDRFGELRNLHLDHNQFNGTIAESLINTGNGRLVSLTLDNNQFTGEVPGNHENTDTLVEYTLHANMFTSLGKDTCKINVFDGGEMVEFSADCDICTCDPQCSNRCSTDEGQNEGEPNAGAPN